MLETGFVVALGLTVWWSNVKWRTRVWMLSHSLFMDIAIFAFLTLVHWGTYSGVMSATVGALIASVMLKCGRWLWGYREGGKYIPGRYSVAHLL